MDLSMSQQVVVNDCASEATSISSCHSKRSLDQQIFDEVISTTSDNYVHIIHGIQGVGKTKLAHSIVAHPECDGEFPDGIVWIDVGFRKALDFQTLTELYHGLCAQLSVRVDFDNILFVSPPNSSDDKSDEMENEERAMWEASDIMGQTILSQKKVLICLDGLHNIDDARFFKFVNDEDESTFAIESRVLITTTTLPSEVEGMQIWEMTPLCKNDAQEFFLDEVSVFGNDRTFLDTFGDAFESCQGIPNLIKALGRMLRYQYISGDQQSLLNIRETLNQFNGELMNPQTQMFTLLESTLSNTTIGNELTRIPWVCFEAFCLVFKRDECYRPLVSKGAVVALFSVVVVQILNAANDDMNLNNIVGEILDKFVRLGFLTEIEGLDEYGIPQLFYRVHSDVYQEFGEQSTDNVAARKKLHRAFAEDALLFLKRDGTPIFSNDIGDYIVQRLPFHLMSAEKVNDCARTLQSTSFIKERLRYLGKMVAARIHVTDSESFLDMVTKDSMRESEILLLSYERFLDVLKEEYDSNNDIERNLEIIFEVIWTFSYSLFKNGFTNDGYKILQKGKEYDEIVFNRFMDLDINKLHSFCNVDVNDFLNSSRAQIKLGSTLTESRMKQESIVILELGLKNLQQALGCEIHLEVARAHMYVGELLYNFCLYVDALEKFRKALPILRDLQGEESEELFDALLLIGKAYFRCGDIDTSLGILKCIVFKVSGTTAVSVKVKISEIYMLKGRPKKSIQILQSAKKDSSKPHHLKRINELIGKMETKSEKYQGSKGNNENVLQEVNTNTVR